MGAIVEGDESVGEAGRRMSLEDRLENKKLVKNALKQDKLLKESDSFFDADLGTREDFGRAKMIVTEANGGRNQCQVGFNCNLAKN